jgi:hypothetical protein
MHHSGQCAGRFMASRHAHWTGSDARPPCLCSYTPCCPSRPNSLHLQPLQRDPHDAPSVDTAAQTAQLNHAEHPHGPHQMPHVSTHRIAQPMSTTPPGQTNQCHAHAAGQLRRGQQNASSSPSDRACQAQPTAQSWHKRGRTRRTSERQGDLYTEQAGTRAHRCHTPAACTWMLAVVLTQTK